MLDELSAGQYEDWAQYHRQFNLSFAKTDNFWAMLLAAYHNVHRNEGQVEVRPIDMLPWVDAYAGEDEFLSQIRAFAEQVKK